MRKMSFLAFITMYHTSIAWPGWEKPKSSSSSVKMAGLGLDYPIPRLFFLSLCHLRMLLMYVDLDKVRVLSSSWQCVYKHFCSSKYRQEFYAIHTLLKPETKLEKIVLTFTPFIILFGLFALVYKWDTVDIYMLKRSYFQTGTFLFKTINKWKYRYIIC